MLVFTVSFLIFSLVASEKRLTPEENQQLKSLCGKSPHKPISRKILRGQPTEYGEAPWAVSLLGSGRICSGALISKRHVLTAAHCVDVTTADCEAKKGGTPGLTLDWKAAPGSTCRDEVICESVNKLHELKVVTVSRAYMLESYTALLCNDATKDIAIFELETDVDFDEYINPICIAEVKDQKPGDVAQGYGYGFDQLDRITSGLLKGINWNISQCDIAPADQYCAYGLQKRDGCGGDSGHAMIRQKSDGMMEVIGVYSSGQDCSQIVSREQQNLEVQFGPEFFTYVFDYYPFICEVTGVCPINNMGPSSYKYRTIEITKL